MRQAGELIHQAGELIQVGWVASLARFYLNLVFVSTNHRNNVSAILPEVPGEFLFITYAENFCAQPKSEFDMPELPCVFSVGWPEHNWTDELEVNPRAAHIPPERSQLPGGDTGHD